MSGEYEVSEFEEQVQGVLAVLKSAEGKPGNRASIADYHELLKGLGDIPAPVLTELVARLKTAAVIKRDLYDGLKQTREAELGQNDDFDDFS